MGSLGNVIQRFNLRPRSGTSSQNFLSENVSSNKKHQGKTSICSGATRKKKKTVNDSIPSPSYIHHDVIIDVLNFIGRNEIEKCQLISSNFDHAIKSATTLSLHVLQELLFDKEREYSASIYNPNETFRIGSILYTSSIVKKLLDDKKVLGSLKNCYAMRVKLIIRQDGNELIERLQNIVELIGKRIQTEQCDLIFILDYYKWLHNIPMIFKDLISTDTLNIIFYSFPPLYYVTKHPECLEISDPNTEINLETANCCGSNFKKSKNTLFDFIDGEGLDKKLNRGTLELGHINGNMEDFLLAIIKIFRNSTKLPLLFKRLNFALNARNDDDSIYDNIFIQEGYILYKSLQGRYQDRQREDGWIIEVDFNHEFLMEFTILRPGEERTGFVRR